MKRVHTPDMVAHLWAARAQSSARNAGDTFYFDGATIFSYGSHFPIARLVPHGETDIVLFTTQTYSPTTQRHIAIVRDAVRHLRKVYVHQIRNGLDENLAYEEGKVTLAVQLVAASKKGAQLAKRTRILEEALAQHNQLAEYMRKPTLAMPTDFAAEIQTIGRRAKLREANAKRKATLARKEREARFTARYGTPDTWAANWREGKPAPDRWEWESATGSRMPCLLRAVYRDQVPEPTQGELQTSWGATVPLDHAHRIYRLWARLQGKVPPEGWVNAGNSQEGAVGAFRVDRIDACGTIWAGCHTITADEVRAFGAAMGWEG